MEPAGKYIPTHEVSRFQCGTEFGAYILPVSVYYNDLDLQFIIYRINENFKKIELFRNYFSHIY